ncbi:divalent-cation tolerance protein CutA [Enhygromyxa salina]|uniref:Divalent-cation tolerance protein CutA n=1 Tax=Enhygromyxa salina TaxID=215803 RepID=A0A2S9YQN3_9BACT|nr:divalent-cation tolerance protein CutA [Enhygromyxa salina]PRQ07390.1 Divalent-cation tolerance protein CutA [Enhygromyxa salina]
MPDVGLRLLLCTAPSEAAPGLARALLEAKLIGCANLLPAVRSLYWWEGEIQDDTELLMLMECTDTRADQAVAALAAAHPYDVPKILVIEPTAVTEPYLEWLRSVAPPR